jgi:hypothetical protein
MTSNVRVVVDTNIAVSAALLPRSVSRQAFDLALEHGTVLLSSATVAELNDVLGDFSKRTSLITMLQGRTDQDVVLGQLRVTLQSLFDCAHRPLPKRNPLVIDLTADLDHGLHPLPRHTLRPLPHGLDIDQLGPIPVQRVLPAALREI